MFFFRYLIQKNLRTPKNCFILAEKLQIMNGKLIIKLYILILLFSIQTLSAQDKNDSIFKDMGVSISPSSIHLSVKPGTSVTKEIRVKNDTKKAKEFTVGFQDFEMNTSGKPSMNFDNKKPMDTTVIKTGPKYGLSKNVVVTPSSFILKPGEEIKLKMITEIPDEPDSYIAKWTIITVEEIYERPPLDATDQPNRLSMGVIPTMGFGVYVYQNPPNVKLNQLEIQSLQFLKSEKGNNVTMSVKNTGDGISYCLSYLELTNLKTGVQQKLQNKSFTILPQYHRIFKYDLPAELAPGKYSAIGVVDYGHKEEIIAAEIEFEL